MIVSLSTKKRHVDLPNCLNCSHLPHQLWAGGPYNNVNPNAAAAIPTARQLLNEGKWREAQDLLQANAIAIPERMSELLHTHLQGVPPENAWQLSTKQLDPS